MSNSLLENGAASTDASRGTSKISSQLTARARIVAAVAATGLTATAFASPGTTHTLTQSGVSNWETATWNTTAPDATSVGDIAVYNPSTSAAATTTINGPISLGQLRGGIGSSSTWIVQGSTITMDNSGGLTNPFGTSTASISPQAVAALLTVGSDIVIANTDLTIGALQNSGVAITGSITASTAQNLILLNNSNSSGGQIMLGAIGASGANIAIQTAHTQFGGYSFPITLGGALGPKVTGIDHSAPTELWITADNSTFSGPITLGSGSQLNIRNANALGATGAGGTLTINAGASIGNTGTGAAALVVASTGNQVWNGDFTAGYGSNGGAALNMGTGSVTLGANVKITNGFTGSGGGLFTVGGDISGAGFGITQAAASSGARMTLTGANTFSGKVAIQNGGINVTSLNNVAAPLASSNLGRPTTVSNGTIDFGFGNTTGLLTYTNATGETTDRVINLASTTGTGGATIDQNSSAGLLKFTGGVTSAASATTKTLTLQGSATAATGEISGAIADGAGSPTAVTKLGNGTWVLSGPNTYSGRTQVLQGKLNNVTGFNSVSAPTASSSLGRPTDADTAIIYIGSGTNSGTIVYTGGGETTDRGLNLNGSTVSGTLDQSGTSGLLKITGDVVATGGVGNKTFTIQGSLGGNGELAGAIVDGTGTISKAVNTAYSAGSTTIKVAASGTSATDWGVGALVSGPGIAAGTRSTAIVTASGVTTVTLSTPTDGSGATTDSITFTGGQIAISKAGTNIWTLSNGNSSFSGGVSVAAGTIATTGIGNAGSNSPLGTNAVIRLGVNSSTGGSLIYRGNGETSDKVINMGASSTGGIVLDQSGPLGALKFLSDLTNSGSSKTVTLQGSTDATGELAGKIPQGTGNTSVTKTGTGTWILSADNPYQGPTSINNGLLLINNTTGSGTGTGQINVTATGKLGGTGRIAPTGTAGVSIAAGTVLAPGASIESLELNLSNTTGKLVFAGTGKLEMELGTPNATISSIATNSSDQVIISGASASDVTFASTVIDLKNTGSNVGYYKLFDTDLTTGTTYSNLTVSSGVITAGLTFTNLGAGGSAELLLGDGTTGTANSNDIYLHVITAVPEPTSVAAIALLGVGLLGRRRRLA